MRPAASSGACRGRSDRKGQLRISTPSRGEAAGAEHTAAWNLDPAEYDRRVRAFLEDVIVR